MNFVSKFWRGEHGLAKSYWLFGYVYPLIVGFAVSLNRIFLPSDLTFQVLLDLVLGGLFIVYSVIWIAGTWRAALAYNGLRVWPVLTLVHLIMSGIAIVGGTGILLFAALYVMKGVHELWQFGIGILLFAALHA